MQASYDDELSLAIANSLVDMGGDNDVDADSDLNFAIRESIKLVTQRSKLDTFYVELQGSTKRARLTRQAEENYRYNETSRETLCNKDIYTHLLKYVGMSSLAALYSTSRRSMHLIEEAITRCPIKSLYVDSVKGFKIAAQPGKYKGTLFESIARSVTSIRFRIREAGQVKSSDFLGNVIGPSIKYLYLNVSHICDLEWFLMSYCSVIGYKGNLRVYHELDYNGPHSSYVVYNYGDSLHGDDFRLPVKDLDGSLFNALTNYV